MRGRRRTTTWLYDDPQHPDRVTGTVEAPEWTEGDRAALLGLQAYESTLCPGCLLPKQVAWHSDMDGWFEAESAVCLACTAKTGTGDAAQEQVYHLVHHTQSDLEVAALSPLELGVNTKRPEGGGRQ